MAVSGICARTVASARRAGRRRSELPGAPASGSNRVSPLRATSRASKRPGPAGGPSGGSRSCRSGLTRSCSRPGRTCESPSSWMTFPRWLSATSGPLCRSIRTPGAQTSAGAVDLLFVESAWAGNDGLWRGKIAGPNGPAPIPRTRRLVPGARASRQSSGTRKTRRTMTISFPPPSSSTTSSPPIPAACRSTGSDLGHDRSFRLPFAAQPADP